MKRYQIGRPPKRADIVIPDPNRTVSTLHAELSQDENERWRLIDRGSANGTFIFRNGSWSALERGFIEAHDRLSFGKYIVDATWLIEQAQRLDKAAADIERRELKAHNKPRRRPAPAPPAADSPAGSGRYVRNPETGEVYWRKNSKIPKR